MRTVYQDDAYDLVIVGAGLFGLTVAETVSREADARTLVIDRRPHIGGNAFSSRDPATGIEVHRYGTHIFHTSNEAIVEYVQRFVDWIPYEFTAWSVFDDQLFSLPVNLHTICQLYGRTLSPSEARRLVAADCEGDPARADSFEEKALATVGRRIYEAFFKGYTQKQWQTPPRDLPASIFSRLPVRFSLDDRYFRDSFQALPRGGYGALARAMATSDAVHIALNTSWDDIRDETPPTTPVIYTGGIDEFFNYEFGLLPWRTLDYEAEVIAVDDFQGAPMVNYADPSVPYTRIHEYKHFPHGYEPPKDVTFIHREFSRFAEVGDEPFYPINGSQSRKMLEQYRRHAANQRRRVFFGGRLGSYKYLDMHMAIGAAMRLCKDMLVPYLRGQGPWDAAWSRSAP